MLYLQSIGKHADKLNKYADVKVNVFSEAYHSLAIVDKQHNHSPLHLNISFYSHLFPVKTLFLEFILLYASAF